MCKRQCWGSKWSAATGPPLGKCTVEKSWEFPTHFIKLELPQHHNTTTPQQSRIRVIKQWFWSVTRKSNILMYRAFNNAVCGVHLSSILFDPFMQVLDSHLLQLWIKCKMMTSMTSHSHLSMLHSPAYESSCPENGFIILNPSFPFSLQLHRSN